MAEEIQRDRKAEVAGAVNGLLAQVNDALQGESVTPYKLALVDPQALIPATKNARFFGKADFMQLVKNVEQDSNLSSIPFCWKDGDRYYILSGHHRIESAIEAGITLILVLYTDEDLTPSQKTAIQLSHNSLVGRDDPTVLKELYAGIEDIEAMMYSGLDEHKLATFDPVDMQTFGDADLVLETVVLAFVREEVGDIETMMGEIGRQGKKVYAASYTEWDEFFRAIVTFKTSMEIVNAATAFRAMIEMVREKFGLDDGWDNEEWIPVTKVLGTTHISRELTVQVRAAMASMRKRGDFAKNSAEAILSIFCEHYGSHLDDG